MTQGTSLSVEKIDEAIWHQTNYGIKEAPTNDWTYIGHELDD